MGGSNSKEGGEGSINEEELIRYFNRNPEADALKQAYNDCRNENGWYCTIGLGLGSLAVAYHRMSVAPVLLAAVAAPLADIAYSSLSCDEQQQAYQQHLDQLRTEYWWTLGQRQQGGIMHSGLASAISKPLSSSPEGSLGLSRRPQLSVSRSHWTLEQLPRKTRSLFGKEQQQEQQEEQ